MKVHFTINSETKSADDEQIFDINCQNHRGNTKSSEKFSNFRIFLDENKQKQLCYGRKSYKIATKNKYTIHKSYQRRKKASKPQLSSEKY